MMRYWYFLCAFCCCTTMLFGQNGVTVLEKLQAGETLEIDWVQQQYLSDSGSVVGDYPLFPDQLMNGEGEMHARLKLQLTDEQRLKIWLVSIFSLEFPTTHPFKGPGMVKGLGMVEIVIPEGASFLPIIEDTRYYFNEDKPSPIFFKELSKKPIIYEFDKGILNKNWFKGLEGVTEKMPLYFNASHLENLLIDLLNKEWFSKEYYQLIKTKNISDKLSVCFFRPVLPPKKTVIQGKIRNFHEPKVSFSNFKEGSLLKAFDRYEDIALDSLGQFKFEFVHDKPIIFNLHHIFNQTPIYVEPGDSMQISINANAFFREMRFKGDNATSNEVFMELIHEVNAGLIQDNYIEKSNNSQEQFLAKFQQRQDIQLAFLAHKRKVISIEFYQFLNRRILLENAISILKASSYYFKRDVQFAPSFQYYCQKLNRLFYRLPISLEYFWALEYYLIFHNCLLKGKYVYKKVNKTPWDYRFIFGNMLLTAPENIFKIGELALYFKNRGNSDKKFQELHKILVSSCTLPESKAILHDYVDSTITFPKRRVFRYLRRYQKAPDWSFVLSNSDSITLKDYKEDYLFLHIGISKNLKAAQSDIETIRKETNFKFKTLSIVTSQDSIIERKFKDKVLYINPAEMKILRDNYLITNNANMFYIIDGNGLIRNNLYDTNSFRKLTQNVAKLSKPENTWQPTAIFWRNLGILSLLLLSIAAIYIQRKRTLAKREQQKRQLVELELKGIRAQMNPHFLFNALSSIQNLIRKKEDIAADRYLTQFAGLVRKILRNSEQEFITLEEEIAAIKQYCSLEALRTPFDYEIELAADIDEFNTYIPGMLLQPLVENAILHGLMPQKGVKNLWITIQTHPKGLACQIMDNGIGLEKAKLQKQSHKAHRKSFGVALIKQRIELLLGQSDEAFLTIQDRSKLTPPATGTIVNLIIPIEK